MAMQSYQQKIVDLMIQQELTLAEVYQFLSKRHKDHTNFWRALQNDELKHAQWIEYFKKRADDGDAVFFEDKIRTYTIQSYLEYLQGVLKKLRITANSFKVDLALAVDIESSLLEKNVLQHFKGDDPELIKTLRNLNTETTEHLKTVKDMWQATKE